MDRLTIVRKATRRKERWCRDGDALLHKSPLHKHNRDTLLRILTSAHRSSPSFGALLRKERSEAEPYSVRNQSQMYQFRKHISVKMGMMDMMWNNLILPFAGSRIPSVCLRHKPEGHGVTETVSRSLMTCH